MERCQYIGKLAMNGEKIYEKDILNDKYVACWNGNAWKFRILGTEEMYYLKNIDFQQIEITGHDYVLQLN